MMKLNRVQLTHFRCFDNLTIELNPQLNILVGMNGVGKTAVLEAIAIGLDECVSILNSTRKIPIKPEDVQRVKTHHAMESCFPVTIHCFVGGEGLPKFEWSIVLKNAHGHLLTQDGKQIQEWARQLKIGAQSAQELHLPLFAYYSTDRSWPLKNSKSFSCSETRYDSPLEGYRDCLSFSSHYQDFQEWFINLHCYHHQTLSEQEERERNQKYHQIKTILRHKKGKTDHDVLNSIEKVLVNSFNQPSNYFKLIHIIQKAVNQAITEWYDLRYDSANQEIIVSHLARGDLPVRFLSEGFRNTIVLIADLTYRTVLLNPHWGEQAPQKTGGIVLIDEIDLYLHPRCQQTILKRLTEIFPQIQFIVTTHSPHILTQVQPHQIQVLRQQEEQIVLGPLNLSEKIKNFELLTETLAVF